MIGCLPVMGLFIFMESVFDRGELYEEFKNQVVITESHLTYGETRTGDTIAVLGTIKNASSVPWESIRFHVDFFDASGKRMDVGEREDLTIHLPANEETSFKVSFRREFPETNYSKFDIRVVTAKDARSRWW